MLDIIKKAYMRWSKIKRIGSMPELIAGKDYFRIKHKDCDEIKYSNGLEIQQNPGIEYCLTYKDLSLRVRMIDEKNIAGMSILVNNKKYYLILGKDLMLIPVG